MEQEINFFLLHIAICCQKKHHQQGSDKKGTWQDHVKQQFAYLSWVKQLVMMPLNHPAPHLLSPGIIFQTILKPEHAPIPL